jgi:hypothetical protein
MICSFYFLFSMETDYIIIASFSQSLTLYSCRRRFPPSPRLSKLYDLRFVLVFFPLVKRKEVKQLQEREAKCKIIAGTSFRTSLSLFLSLFFCVSWWSHSRESRDRLTTTKTKDQKKGRKRVTLCDTLWYRENPKQEQKSKSSGKRERERRKRDNESTTVAVESTL